MPEVRPSRQEWAWVLLLLGGLLGFNLASYNYYPAVWCDEVSFAEPAVNLLNYGSYTTMVWQFQPPDTFPSLNCPLYGLSLVPWLALTGTSLLSVRSFNITLMAVAAFLIWRASWRFGLVRWPVARIALIPVLHLGYGMSYAYRCSRPDILGLVCLLLLWSAFAIQQPRLRQFNLFVLAALTVWIGLQVSLYAWVAAALAWVLLRAKHRSVQPQPAPGTDSGTGTAGEKLLPFVHCPEIKDLVMLALGMTFGAESLVLFFVLKGLLANFLLPTLGLLGKNFVQIPQDTVVHQIEFLFHRILDSYVEDLSSVVLLLGLALLAAPAWKRLTAASRTLVVFSILIYFGVPLFFDLIGHYAFYYSYMRFVPLLLALLAVGSESVAGGTREVVPWVKTVFPGTLIGAALVGLPLQLAIVLGCCQISPRAEVRRTVNSQILLSDVVFTDFPTFFEVKRAARRVYDVWYSYSLCTTHLAGHDFTPEEKRNLTVLVIRPEQKEKFGAFFGGDWRAVTLPFGDTQDVSALARLPIIGKRFAHHATQPQAERFQLQIFRRQDDSAAPAAPTAQ